MKTGGLGEAVIGIYILGAILVVILIAGVVSAVRKALIAKRRREEIERRKSEFERIAAVATQKRAHGNGRFYMTRTMDSESFDNSTALANRLDSFHLSGRTIVGFCFGAPWGEGDEGCYPPPTPESAENCADPENVLWETDTELLILFSDGDILLLHSYAEPSFEIGWEHPVCFEMPQTMSSADILLAPALGQTIKAVDVKTTMSTQDGFGHWIDEGSHRSIEVPKSIALRFENGCALEVSNWLDFVYYGIVDSAGKYLKESLRNRLSRASLFRKTHSRF